ncbi:hypothetical protein [Niabella hirudinis]|uniref:hypothetical protein n=1 Tax=Niabella hirudinis TaxID=1285929 RepID=UPI003EBAF33C
MKTSALKHSKYSFIRVLTVLLVIVGLSSCADPYYPSYGYYRGGQQYRRIPPGQAKKYYGSKSARDYAPGHNKHYYRY